jgi:hypothetical protein
MKRLSSLVPLLPLLLVCCSLFAGCSQTLQNTADKPSPYKGDQVLYAQDVSIIGTSDSLKDFLSWELRWRGIVPKDITAFADKVRSNLATWNGSAIRLRDAYAANPTTENEAGYRAALAELRQALTESAIYLTRYKTLK